MSASGYLFRDPNTAPVYDAVRHALQAANGRRLMGDNYAAQVKGAGSAETVAYWLNRAAPYYEQARKLEAEAAAQAAADAGESVFHLMFVPHADVAALVAVGWVDCGFAGGVHGCHARTLRWQGEGPPLDRNGEPYQGPGVR